MPALNYIAVIVKTNKQTEKSNHYIQQTQRVFSVIKEGEKSVNDFYFKEKFPTFWLISREWKYEL